ncbi:MAG: GyrI-like domain-containing protein [Sphaerochaeta sp.]|nr:GyrI-like domain-containing protein [Sphaerochaeta sp.]
MGIIDVTSEYRSLYHPKNEPSLVSVPAFPYFIVDGEGDPADESYEKAVQLLYELSYTLKMGFTKEPWYRDFVVSPLEGVWTALEVENRDTWRWSSMIVQPSFVTEEMFHPVAELCSFKKKISTKDARFAVLEDGLCVTMMHIGSYAEEDLSIEKMEAFCVENDLLRSSESHREIYLSDPKKTKPENLKTVLRFAVKRV